MFYLFALKSKIEEIKGCKQERNLRRPEPQTALDTAPLPLF